MFTYFSFTLGFFIINFGVSGVRANYWNDYSDHDSIYFPKSMDDLGAVAVPPPQNLYDDTDSALIGNNTNGDGFCTFLDKYENIKKCLTN